MSLFGRPRCRWSSLHRCPPTRVPTTNMDNAATPRIPWMISILPLTRRILYSVARKSNHVEDLSYWEKSRSRRGSIHRVGVIYYRRSARVRAYLTRSTFPTHSPSLFSLSLLSSLLPLLQGLVSTR
jgi:hypothetical protein